MNSFSVDRTDQVRIEKNRFITTKPFHSKGFSKCEVPRKSTIFEEIVRIIRGSTKIKNKDFVANTGQGMSTNGKVPFKFLPEKRNMA